MSFKETSHRVIHWVGAGLASAPGIISLAKKWEEITLWDRDIQNIEDIKNSSLGEGSIIGKAFDISDEISIQNFLMHVNENDVVVSMLPPVFHVKLARLAMSKKAHLVTSSYISEEMQELHDEAVTNSLSLVNEVGLDPGVDHLFSHLLIDHAKKEGQLGQGKKIEFLSYCGGIPAADTPFKYKFSWTPFGVLSALKNKAYIIKNSKRYEAKKTWDEVNEFNIHGEIFEVYPNRDSLPYIEEYGLEKETNLQNFIRGTLRPFGWKEAWGDVFDVVSKSSEGELKEYSSELLRKYPYEKGEKDRVLLYAALIADDWKASITLDMVGSGHYSAMAMSVSLTVAQAVNALLEGSMPFGVQQPPYNPIEARKWLAGLVKQGLKIKTENIEI